MTAPGQALRPMTFTTVRGGDVCRAGASQRGPCGAIVFERIARAAKDVSPGTALLGFDLESKIKDARYAWFKRAYGERCWELDALGPVMLRQRVRAAVTRRLDLTKWNRAVEVEKAERQSMRSFMSDWNRMLSAGTGQPK